ncbi:MAG: helix-turn-helix transcriptional regulator [Parvibaculaceae bacterium]|nr:helix-turn-helix transcriptional regulator [Parvibaculaceae bacterium]HBM88330.1 XRE family transcriptional regulator [Rhodobiaceae bacterium]|tara:strand:+ start:943 stop:1698 length:756 start_codon:yes stop_codon:yes gene_type:complete
MSSSLKQDSRSSEPQLVYGPGGEALYALVPVADYEQLKRAAEDIVDIKAANEALLGDRADLIPAEVVHRIADGENPVRVWREHRGLKGVELARAAGISPAYLSEIETGKKDGTFRTMTAIGHCLGLPLDDLAPIADDDERVSREQAARINDIRAQIRFIEGLIVGPGDFSTGAVRQAAATLATDAEQMLTENGEQSDWLPQVLEGVEEILDLIDRAEGDIIETARSTRADLEKVVTLSAFRAPINPSGGAT